MSASTALSRVTGFARTWATAYALGVTVLAASYSVANNIPNMMYELVAGGVISSLFVPIFLERLSRHGREDAWRFASTLFNLTVLVLAVVSVLGVVFAAEVVRTQTFRISAEEAALATEFFRFFAVQILAYGAGAVIQGLLNAQRRYLWPALGPVFNNIAVIIALLVVYVPLYPHDPDLAFMLLAIGTTLGVFLQFAVQVPSLIRTGVRYTLTIDTSHPGMRVLYRMALPTVLYVATNVVAVSFRNAYAFEASPDGPARLMYAWMFYQLPYGIFAVALATAIFTELSEAAGRDEWDRFRERFSAGMRTTAVAIIPLAVMLAALSGPLVTLYRAGRFTAADIPLVAEILVWWAAGLFFFAGFMFVLKSFYALQDTRTPALVNVALTGVQIGLYALLVGGVSAWPGIGLIGIPIADGVFHLASLAVLSLLLRRRVGQLELKRMGWLVARILVAAIAGGAAALGVTSLIENFEHTPGIAAATVVSAGIVGLAVTYALAWVMRVTEISAGAKLITRTLLRGSRRVR